MTTCLFVFQGNYWSSNVNEVQGFVMDQEGKVVHRLFGKWHEGLYCGVPPSAKCIWRPGRHWFFIHTQSCSYIDNTEYYEIVFSVLVCVVSFPCQAPCPQTTSCTMASPGSPLNWMNCALSWKMFCPAQMLDLDLIKGTKSEPQKNSATEFQQTQLKRHVYSWHYRVLPGQLSDHLVYCMCLLKSNFWVKQVSWGGELGDGFLREAAYRGSTENQEEVERGERHQTGATILQVRTKKYVHTFFLST